MTGASRHVTARLRSGFGLLGATAAAATAWHALFTSRTPPIRRRNGRPPKRSVAELSPVRIGGSEQWLLERSEDVDNPVVLFVHGGPGTSQLTINRRNTRRLERDFVVVNWDQRGAGKSYRAIHDRAAMTVDQIVEDTRQVVGYLLSKYGQNKLILVGHSWGSALGALTVARYPELVHCYLGIGQIANMIEGERESYAWTLAQARQRGNQKAVEKLEALGSPPYPGDWQRKTMTQRRYLARFGGEIHANPIGAFGLVFSGLVISPEYTCTDRVNVLRGISASMRLLWPQLLEIDLFEMIPELKVPVFLVEGRNDHEVPSSLSAQWFEHLVAPSKQLYWFERSAHMANFEERDLFDTIMLQQVRPMTLSSTRSA